MKKKVILISGHLQSGKNTFTNFLQKEIEKQNLKVYQDSFAKDLKIMCQNDFKILANILENISEEIKAGIGLFVDNRENMLYPNIITSIDNSINKLKIKDKNWFEEKTTITRAILQLVGTNIIKKRVDENWWVNRVRNRCISSQDDVIIITDCRFPNEITEMMCDDYETITIRINRNINTNSLIASHDSETSLDKWNEFDFIVENNGTLEELRCSAKTIADYLGEEYKEENIGLFTRLSNENLHFLNSFKEIK